MELTLPWAITIVAAYLLTKYLIERRYPNIGQKVVWIVEDSDIDQIIYSLKLDDIGYCKVRYFKSLRGLGWRLMLSEPSAVIVDVHLQGKTLGIELYKVCVDLGIPVRIVTGDRSALNEVPSEDIVIKDPGCTHFDKLSTWAKTVCQ